MNCGYNLYMTQIVEESSAAQRVPNGIRLRRGGEEDEFAAFEVMRRAMGFTMNWNAHIATRQHLRTTENASFWVAEESPKWGRKRIVGYARSLVREGFWNLNEFFIAPEYQRRGIGTGLLTQCLDDGARFGAHTHFVLASQHFGADALYMRAAGCFPRVPMVLMAGSLGALPSPPQQESAILDSALPALRPVLTFFSFPHFAQQEPLCADPIVLTPEIQAEIDALDRAIVGYARPQEHRHWANQMGGAKGVARLFRKASAGSSGEIVGYGYMSTHASGPVSAVEQTDLPRMTAHLALLQRTLVPRDELIFFTEHDHFLALTGTNDLMLKWLLDCGWRIAYNYLLMSSRDFGQFKNYICHNPLYMP